ncbi:hypothetical protein [Lactococcus lactis]|uniref:hypothetical protein n=1 Tax=Lactococcus lactis TaxID=1358 RepID=UPI0022E5BE28|nr:hypothetical protein [Lactococcus lactis]
MQEKFEVIISEVKKGKIIKEDEFQNFMKEHEVLDLKIYSKDSYVIFNIFYKQKGKSTEEFEELFKTINKDFILAVRECSFKRMEIVANLSFLGELADLIHNLDISNNKGFLIAELLQYSYYLEKNIVCKKDLPDFIIDTYKQQYKILDTFLSNC